MIQLEPAKSGTLKTNQWQHAGDTPTTIHLHCYHAKCHKPFLVDRFELTIRNTGAKLTRSIACPWCGRREWYVLK
ncbi:MAG: hypothetical protein V3V10_07170, partial [Planctomycetota bacterium]